MPAPIPTAMLCLITGLAVGTAGGYFWGADSQPAPSARADQARQGLAGNSQSRPNDSSAGLAAALQNPTGLRLVGTVVQPEHSKSKAWLLEVATNNTQAYGEGDVLPGGYKLSTIGAEDLQVTKDGFSFSIRRSSASGETASVPCETLAQNASNAQNPQGAPGNGRHPSAHPVVTNPSFGIFDFSGRRRTSENNQTASAQSSSGNSKSSSGGSGTGSTGGTDSGAGSNSGSRANSSGSATKTRERNWGERTPMADGAEVRAPGNDALSSLPADDN